MWIHVYLCVFDLEADTHQIHSQIHRSQPDSNLLTYLVTRGTESTRMAHKTADKLVFCHEAMHVQLRLQDAGWSADVERHQSDEDSDDSEKEQDEDERAVGKLSESTILRLMA